MKENEARFGEGHPMVLYVEKEDRTYGPVRTGSYMARNYLDDFFGKRARLEARCRERLAKGEISPVAYYAALIDIAPADLARRVRVSRWTLRRHMTPRGFAGLRPALAARYAEVFAVPVAHLLRVPDAPPAGEPGKDAPP